MVVIVEVVAVLIVGLAGVGGCSNSSKSVVVLVVVRYISITGSISSGIQMVKVCNIAYLIPHTESTRY